MVAGGLSRRERSLLNLGILTALNRSHELAVHVRGAVRNGCTPEEIQEVLLQAAIYCGVPAAMEGFRVAEAALAGGDARARDGQPGGVTEAARIGFVGTGAMGVPIAGALLDAGHALSVFDTRAVAAEPLVARGARLCATAAEVAGEAATVFVSLPTPDAVRAVLLGPGGLVEGSALRTFVDLSTTGSLMAEELAAALSGTGVAYVDAPVSGGVAGARAHTLAVMASGNPGAFAEVKPLLETFAANVFHVGEQPGQGQIAKLLNNLLSATAMAITSEATTFGVRAGLDPAILLQVFNAGSGRNTATSDKFPKQVLTREFASGFRMQLMAKDVELCLGEARARNLPLLVGGLVQQLWTLAAAGAGDDADFTEIVKLFESWAAVTVGGS